jgi:hypothetical protein
MNADGNERLTSLTGVVLLVLLAVEGETILMLGSQLTLHIFLGVALIPVVCLKLGTTAWRFGRYYSGAREYVAKGPPTLLLRVLVAPLVVAATTGLFGTGVLLLVVSPQRGLLVGLHKASFIVWFAAMSAHVLAHALKLPAHVRGELARRLPKAGTRSAAIAASVVAGLGVAVWTLPQAHAWTHWASSHHHHDR